MFYGLTSFETGFDTAIAAYVLDVSRNNYDLKTIALEQLHVNIASLEEFLAENGQMD